MIDRDISLTLVAVTVFWGGALVLGVIDTVTRDSRYAVWAVLAGLAAAVASMRWFLLRHEVNERRLFDLGRASTREDPPSTGIHGVSR